MTRRARRSAPPGHRSRSTPPPFNRCCAGVTPGPSTDVAGRMPDAVSLAGGVLAGGESRRMARDRATLPTPGSAGGSSATTMVEHVVGTVGQRCEPVFVMAAQGQPLPALQGARVMRDEWRGLGPLPAAARGLRAAAEAGARFVFFCPDVRTFLAVELID